jgi:hypothetical protein
MKDNRFGFGERTIPLKAPVDSGGTAFATAFVDMSKALRATFSDYFGVITAASADQVITITLTDTWGAVTAVAATGLTIDTTAKDGMMVQIDVNPALFDAAVAGGRWVRLVQGIDAGGSATFNALWLSYEPMYPQASIGTAL